MRLSEENERKAVVRMERRKGEMRDTVKKERKAGEKRCEARLSVPFCI